MNEPRDNSAPKGLRGWWASPPRTGMARSIVPWEYRHLRASAVVRIVAGALLVVGGVMFLSYRAYGWAALFLVIGGLNLGGGYWYITMARSASTPS